MKSVLLCDGIVVAKCLECGADAAMGESLCPECRRGHAEHEARKLLSDVQALRDGTAPFDVLTPSERREQLAAVLGDGAPPLPNFGTMDDTALIELIAHAPDSAVELLEAATAELARRLDAVSDNWAAQRGRVPVEGRA